MATKALARSPIVIQMPRGRGRVRRAARRVVHVARRGGRHVARHALPVTGLAVGGAVTGYLYGKGMFDKLPVIMGSKMMTIGLAGYIATRWSRNSTIRNAGAAALAFAAMNWGIQQAGGTGIAGDDGSAGDDF